MLCHSCSCCLHSLIGMSMVILVGDSVGLNFTTKVCPTVHLRSLAAVAVFRCVVCIVICYDFCLCWLEFSRLSLWMECSQNRWQSSFRISVCSGYCSVLAVSWCVDYAPPALP